MQYMKKYIKNIVPATFMMLALGATSCIGDLDVDPIDPNIDTNVDLNGLFNKCYANMALAGNGEPTAHPHFPEIIEDTRALRDRYFPKAKISVLSNVTQIFRPEVFEALGKVDNNILKLDTVDGDYISRVDRPTGRYEVGRVVERLKDFRGKVIIQTMFMKGMSDGVDVDNTSDRFVEPWLRAVKKIAPSQVMIYTIDRETPDHELRKATHEELDRIAGRIRQEGLEVSVSY